MLVTAMNPYGEDNGQDLGGYISPSYDSQETQVVNLEARYQIDHKTLWLIANGMVRPGGPAGPRPYKPGPLPNTPPPRDLVTVVEETIGLGIVPTLGRTSHA